MPCFSGEEMEKFFPFIAEKKERQISKQIIEVEAFFRKNISLETFLLCGIRFFILQYSQECLRCSVGCFNVSITPCMNHYPLRDCDDRKSLEILVLSLSLLMI